MNDLKLIAEIYKPPTIEDFASFLEPCKNWQVDKWQYHRTACVNLWIDLYIYIRMSISVWFLSIHSQKYGLPSISLSDKGNWRTPHHSWPESNLVSCEKCETCVLEKHIIFGYVDKQCIHIQYYNHIHSQYMSDIHYWTRSKNSDKTDIAHRTKHHLAQCHLPPFCAK